MWFFWIKWKNNIWYWYIKEGDFFLKDYCGWLSVIRSVEFGWFDEILRWRDFEKYWDIYIRIGFFSC